MIEPTGPLPGPRAPRPRHVPLAQTTLPRYPPPDLDAAPHLVVAAGEDAATTARDLLRNRTPGHDRWCAPPDVAAELTGLVTGWRVLAVGPERDVQAVRTAALAAGALDAEVVLVATDAGDPGATRVRALFCGGCHRIFDARVAPGDPVACPGCRAALTVAEHHSHRHGAFLAVPSGRPAPDHTAPAANPAPNERHPRATPLPERPPRSPGASVRHRTGDRG